ncbi:hypothetical protein ACRAWC_22555 [Leifsonia sp. L25]|uniref:glycoside hydrolase family 38 N-terminal domain-containing protein n=1 Tax=Leifsonia sp. L25 TaxID=3423957 RepID=UPI003D687DAD
MPRIRRLLLLGHTHHDVGYTNSPRIIDGMHARIVREVLRLADEDTTTPDAPDRFRWTFEVARPVLNFLRDAAPAEVARLRELVADGTLAVTGGYLNMTQLPDLPEFEAGYRPLGRLRDAGIPIRTEQHGDVNGIAWGVADAMLDAGVDRLVMALNPDHGRAPLEQPSASGGRRRPGAACSRCSRRITASARSGASSTGMRSSPSAASSSSWNAWTRATTTRSTRRSSTRATTTAGRRRCSRRSWATGTSVIPTARCRPPRSTRRWMRCSRRPRTTCPRSAASGRTGGRTATARRLGRSPCTARRGGSPGRHARPSRWRRSAARSGRRLRPCSDTAAARCASATMPSSRRPSTAWTRNCSSSASTPGARGRPTPSRTRTSATPTGTPRPASPTAPGTWPAI